MKRLQPIIIYTRTWLPVDIRRLMRSLWEKFPSRSTQCTLVLLPSFCSFLYEVKQNRTSHDIVIHACFKDWGLQYFRLIFIHDVNYVWYQRDFASYTSTHFSSVSRTRVEWRQSFTAGHNIKRRTNYSLPQNEPFCGLGKSCRWPLVHRRQRSCSAPANQDKTHILKIYKHQLPRNNQYWMFKQPTWK